MSTIKLFEAKQVRSLWDAEREAWFFSIVDVVAVLMDSVDASAYWFNPFPSPKLTGWQRRMLIF